MEGEKKVELGEGDSVCFYASISEKHYLENCSDTDAEFLIFRRANTNSDAVC